MAIQAQNSSHQLTADHVGHEVNCLQEFDDKEQHIEYSPCFQL